MRLWQKIFICLLIIFLVGFDAATFLIIKRSNQDRISSELKVAYNEAFLINKSVTDRLAGVAENYLDFNQENIKQYLWPYAEYYLGQGTYFLFVEDQELLFSSFPQTIENINFSNGLTEINSELYLTIKNKVDLRADSKDSYHNYSLIYLKSEEDLREQQVSIVTYALQVSVIVSVLMMVVVIITLLRFTKPIRELNRAAKEIAAGNYGQKINLQSRDEVGDLAQSFNEMAKNIRARIMELKKMTNAKQSFIDDLAHEMRTPMTAIVGYSELIKNSKLSTEEKNITLNYLIEQSHYLQKLAKKLMTLTQLRHEEINLKMIALRPILEKIKATLDFVYPQQKVIWQADLQIKTLRADEELLTSLLLNILENSYRGINGSGEIKIRTVVNEKGVELIITDDGQGIPNSEIEKVTNAFYRLDKSRSKKNGGLGLGLSICREICRLHEAVMKIDSPKEGGTKVTIIFTKALQNDDDFYKRKDHDSDD